MTVHTTAEKVGVALVILDGASVAAIAALFGLDSSAGTISAAAGAGAAPGAPRLLAAATPIRRLILYTTPVMAG